MAVKLGVIGGGVMASAIVSRLLAGGTYQSTEILISEPTLSQREALHQQYGVGVTDDNNLAAMSPVLMLAIKPQVFDRVVAQLSPLSNNPQLVLSILAGVKIAQLEGAFPDRAVIRTMPNTPATVGMGITALSAGARVDAAQIELATQIFQAVGEVITVPESLLDAVTGLSGSGPAYIAIAIEALADGGVAAGLPRPIADRLALQTVLGTATLLNESQIHPAQLKDRVTSPGGTTIAGITKLEQAGFRSALIEAVIAAATRSQELGK
ncbi:pyrroline-5-carboxylate reductase [Chamaesiphon minutus]|uniref:Pyrroline-5-carboxylate reductase n=1 Tax=Chamaesiphon minutus (strain ATCC 27169 / PCC 6605) TaxID=1173020 RepID=K9UMS3_CHAP6|nr:pyrroline-5-carboxylate reductase [Chamaesiphon minutus]AFY96397.1 pyrroline-5-carboxylate reductase [Chamaesiphon minutus PCC 6605]